MFGNDENVICAARLYTALLCPWAGEGEADVSLAFHTICKGGGRCHSC